MKPAEPVSYQSLTMVPLVAARDGEPGYRILDEAQRDGTVTIGEVSEGGSVPELRVRNDGPVPVLLDREQLVGAKQNRVLNLTVLVPAGKKLRDPGVLDRTGSLGIRKP